MNQLAFTKNLDSKDSEGLHIGADTLSEHVTHSLKHALKFTALPHSYTHTFPSLRGRAHLSFSLSLVSVLLEQRLKEKRGHKREHTVPPFTQDFVERK